MKKQFVIMIMALLPMAAVAQSDDFGLDFSLEAQKKLSKQWSVSLEGEYRSRNNAKTNDRWSVGLNVDYKVAKWLKASAGYTLLYDNNERISYYEATDDAVLDGDAEVGDPKKCAQYWQTRHRFNVSLTASQKFGNWKFSLRERWQYTYRPERTIDRYDVDDEEYEERTYPGMAKHLLRSRLQVEYGVPGTGLSPFANVEVFNGWSLVKTRYTVGMDYDLSKKHSLGLFYRYQAVHDDTDNEEPDRHLIGFSYKYKF